MEQRQAIATTNFVSDRTPRALMAPMLKFDLMREAQLLRHEQTFLEHGHNARTLIKHSELRMVLIALAAGIAIEERAPDERVTIQPLRGRLRVRLPTEDVELAAGCLLALDRQIPCRIEAIEPSDLMLWVSWSQEHA